MRYLTGLVVALACAGALIACGPGTGGTGTGPNISTGLAAGTYGDEELALSVGETRVELSLPCQRFVYEGGWAFDAQGQADLFGRWDQVLRVGDRFVMQQENVRLTLVAGLPDAQGLRLELTVTNPAGQTLLGPVLLAQQTQAAVPIPCLSSY